jgi:hypothetical protein
MLMQVVVVVVVVVVVGTCPGMEVVMGLFAALASFPSLLVVADMSAEYWCVCLDVVCPAILVAILRIPH